jgi:DNA-binding CsgD family transcriptional regulator
MKADVLDVIDAAYQLDADEETWLRRLGETAYGLIGAGAGILAYTYAVDGDRVRLARVVGVEQSAEQVAALTKLLDNLPRGYVSETFVRVSCGLATCSGSAGARAFARAALGKGDLFVVNGIDPTGLGVYLGAYLPRSRPIAPRTSVMWSRVAAHLAAAHRLRRKLPAGGGERDAEAILSPDGKTAHAVGDARAEEARRALAQAVRAVDRARSRLRRDDDRAVASRKGLVAARWSLVDHFESDGKRYLLAHANESAVSGFAALTAREKQALGFAALGHSNKLIAYELGIAASTVAVLLHRAARKLGSAGRRDLIARYLAGMCPPR